MKYIFIRHWDYWYGVYNIEKCKDVGIDEVEFHISDEDDREAEGFFHFDFYTLPALARMVEDNGFIESDNPEYPMFIERGNALKKGDIEFFIGSLYYQTFYPDLTACNNELIEGKNIFDFKSPPCKPHYAVIFINEKRPLMPELLIKWTVKVCKSLFKEQIVFQLANVPTVEQTLASYKEDVRF